MKKKTLILVLSVAVIAAAAIGGTIAYFSETKTANNTFTVGNVNIELTEPNWAAQGSVDADTVYPGEPLAKDPTIKNTGANPCMIRVKVTMPFDGITYRTDWVENKLGSDWYKASDGYFYYMKPLDLDATTDALFDQVVMPTTLTNDRSNPLPVYNIKVDVQAVQAQGIFPSFSRLTGGDGMDINNDGTLDGHIDATEFAAIQAFFTTVGF